LCLYYCFIVPFCWAHVSAGLPAFVSCCFFSFSANKFDLIWFDKLVINHFSKISLNIFLRCAQKRKIRFSWIPHHRLRTSDVPRGTGEKEYKERTEIKRQKPCNQRRRRQSALPITPWPALCQICTTLCLRPQRHQIRKQNYVGLCTVHAFT